MQSAVRVAQHVQQLTHGAAPGGRWPEVAVAFPTRLHYGFAMPAIRALHRQSMGRMARATRESRRRQSLGTSRSTANPVDSGLLERQRVPAVFRPERDVQTYETSSVLGVYEKGILVA